MVSIDNPIRKLIRYYINNYQIFTEVKTNNHPLYQIPISTYLITYKGRKKRKKIKEQFIHD